MVLLEEQGLWSSSLQLKVVSRHFPLSRGFVYSSRFSVNAEIRDFFPHDSNVQW